MRIIYIYLVVLFFSVSSTLSFAVVPGTFSKVCKASDRNREKIYDCVSGLHANGQTFTRYLYSFLREWSWNEFSIEFDGGNKVSIYHYPPRLGYRVFLGTYDAHLISGNSGSRDDFFNKEDPAATMRIGIPFEAGVFYEIDFLAFEDKEYHFHSWKTNGRYYRTCVYPSNGRSACDWEEE